MIHRPSVRSAAIRVRIRSALALVTLMLALPAGSLAQIDLDAVPHVRNDATPAGPLQTLRLEEQWSVGGGEDEGVVLGVIRQAVTDADGNLYLLDTQLMQVHVFSAAGAYLRSICREGEGPGEVSRAADLLWMPDGTLGVLQGFPGKFVKLDRDGTPKGELTGGGQDPGEGGFRGINSALFRAGQFVVSGETMSSNGQGFSRQKYLSLWNADGSEKRRLLEKQAPGFSGQPRFIEKEEFFADAGRWDIGPDGRIYAAPYHTAYTVLVYDPAGQLAFVIDRAFTSWKRTAAEKEEVGGFRVVADGHELKVERQVEDLDPCIRGLRATQNGELWVLSSRGVREQPAGTFQTWDVFDHEGRFARQVAVACQGDPLADALIFVDDEHAVLLRGLSEGPSPQQEEEERRPMEVIYCRVAASLPTAH